MKTFNPGDILLAEDLNVMSNLIEDVSVSFLSISDVLLDDITECEYTLECKNVPDVEATSETNMWATSTFSGWAFYLGQPTKIDRVRFRFYVRSGYPLSKVLLKFFIMPELSEMTFNPSNKKTYSPLMSSWQVLGSYLHTFKTELTTVGKTVATIDLPSTLVNANNKHICMQVAFDNLVTMGYVVRTIEGVHFNPYVYYSVGGQTTLSLVSGGGSHDQYEYDSNKFFVFPAEAYSKMVVREYKGIKTDSEGKFNTAVIDSINNSDTFNTVFSQKKTPFYAFGPQNLFVNTSHSYQALTSTFTGRLVLIGKVDPNKELEGVKLKIRSRALDGAGGHCTKVYAYLYTVDTLPLSSLALNWSQCGSLLVASGVADCDINVDTPTVVDVYFKEPFKNTNNKYLAIGFNLDTYCHMLFVADSNLTTSKVVGSLDGSTYTKIDAYYATNKNNSPSWSRVWADDKQFCYTLFSAKKSFDFGEGFYEYLDEALPPVVEPIVEEYILDISVNISPTAEVRLPKKYDLVVGDKFQMFYEGVIKSFNPLDQGIVVTCQVGDLYPRYYEFTPSDEHANHTYSLTIKTRSLDGQVTSIGTTSIAVHPKLTNATTPANLNILGFGDSLTNAGTWFCEGLRRIYGSTSSGASGPTSIGVTNTVTTYGTKTNTNNTYTIHHEGYGGWTWASFLATTSGNSTTSQMTIILPSAHGLDLDTVLKSIWVDNNNLQWELEDFPNASSIKFNRGPGNTGKQSTITLPTSISCSTYGLSYNSFTANWGSANPFYDDITGLVSFTAHALRFNNPGADIVACLLTWNGASMSQDFTFGSSITTHMTNATTLLRKIHTDFPNAKIIVMGILISSLTGGCGANYHATGSYSDMWCSAFYAFEYNKLLELLVTNEEFGEYCYYVDVKGLFDTRYMMSYSNVAVNSRKSNVTEMRGTNGVHPSTEGYYQIGDAFYRKLTAVIPTLLPSS